METEPCQKIIWKHRHKAWRQEGGAAPAHAGFMGGTDECDTCTRAHPRRSLRPRTGGQASEGRGRPAPLTMNAAGLRGARPAAPCPRASGAPAGPRAAAPAQRAGAAGRSIARRCGAADPRAPFRRVRPGWWGPWALGGGAQAGRPRASPGPASWGRWHGALRAPDRRVQGDAQPVQPGPSCSQPRLQLHPQRRHRRSTDALKGKQPAPSPQRSCFVGLFK